VLLLTVSLIHYLLNQPHLQGFGTCGWCKRLHVCRSFFLYIEVVNLSTFCHTAVVVLIFTNSILGYCWSSHSHPILFLSGLICHAALPLYLHYNEMRAGPFATKYNKMRAGQYASGLSARTGTTKSHIKHWIKNWFTPLTRILISRVNVTEVFLHTIRVSECRDSLGVLFPTVSHDIYTASYALQVVQLSKHPSVLLLYC